MSESSDRSNRLLPSDRSSLADLSLPELTARAEAGDPAAQYELGRAWASDRADSQAAVWYRKAAEAGHVEAQFALGWLYEHGWALPADGEQAALWFWRAAEQGHAEARERVAWDTRRLRNRAEAGDPKAQYELGLLYAVDWDQAAAHMWFMKAAEQGDSEAQFQMGLICEQDETESAAWFRKAAEQGHPDAQFRMGRAYAAGAGVEKDLAKSVYWFGEAAARGHVDAQFEVYWAHVFGWAGERNPTMAVSWLRKAARNGHVEAHCHLGWAYATGDGVEKDEEQALDWFRRASENGSADAQFELADAYWSGSLGLPRDPIEAHKWSLLAGLLDASSPDKRRIDRLEASARSLSEAARREAEWRARAWKEKFDRKISQRR